MGLQLADAVDHVEGFEQGRGHGDSTVDAGAALFQALEDEHAGGEVDAIGGEGEGLGEAASGVGEGHAERSDCAVAKLGLAEEGVALAGCEIFPGAVGGVQLHPALDGGGEGSFVMPGPGRATPWRGAGRRPAAFLVAAACVVTLPGPDTRAVAWHGAGWRVR